MAGPPPKIALALQLGDDARLVVKFARKLGDGDFRLGPPMMVLERGEFVEDAHITCFLEPNPRRDGLFTPHATVERSRKRTERLELAALAPNQVETGIHAVMESMSAALVESLVPRSIAHLEDEGWMVAAIRPKVIERWVRRIYPERPSYTATLDTVCALAGHAIGNALLPSSLQYLVTPFSPCTLFRFEGEQIVTGTLFWFPDCDAVDPKHPLSKLAATSGYGLIQDLGSVFGAAIESQLPPSAIDHVHNRVEAMLATCSRRSGLAETCSDDREFIASLMPIFGQFAMTLANVALGKELGASVWSENCPALLI